MAHFLRRARTRLRRRINRTSIWVAARSTSDNWIDSKLDNGTLVRTARIPRMFSDKVALQAFLDAAFPVGCTLTPGPGGGDTIYSGDFDERITFAERITALPAKARTRLYFHHQSDNTFSQVRFEQRTKVEKASTRIRANDVARLDMLWKHLDAHTIEMPRAQRRLGLPLVEPLTVPEEAQARREFEISKTASKKGAFWGAVTGFVTAVITGIVTAWASTPPG